MPPLLLLRLGAALLALVGIIGLVWTGVHHIEAIGEARVQARWDAQAQADQLAADARRESQRLASSAASRDFETWRTQHQAQATQALAGLQSALQRPICPADGASGVPHARQLADLLVPADVVRRLRDAGAAPGTAPGH